MSKEWLSEPNLIDFINKQREKASSDFDFGEWISNAANNFISISYTTHAVKMTHPMAGGANDIADVTTILHQEDFQPDGYLHTGNTKVDIDIETSARHLPIVKFLEMVLSDGRKIREHILLNTELAQSLLSICEDGVDVRNKLLEVFERSNGNTHSSSKYLPQVYFPISNDEYHILSALTPSSLLFELKKRINAMHYSDQAKESKSARYENKQADGYREIKDITVIGFGGTKPQNASFLNSENAGRAYLLNSEPPKPVFKTRTPRRDFFAENPALPKSVLMSFHAMCSTSRYAKGVLKWRDDVIERAFDIIVVKAIEFRSNNNEWPKDSVLPEHQRIILDVELEHCISREVLSLFAADAAHWFVRCYNNQLKDDAHPLGELEMDFIHKIAIRSMQEAFL
ncbi:hypothetical protein OKZ62_001761 [Vibrio navarrensis]|nr:hypothetical protein [Vibrio navarrensis]